jgi:membrane protein implicated in regulation of membrane protease activity
MVRLMRNHDLPLGGSVCATLGAQLKPDLKERRVELAFWAWVTVAVILAAGEILSSELYVLPFAAGAGVAAALTALDASAGWQWIAFAGVSSVLTVLIRRAIARRDRLS